MTSPTPPRTCQPDQQRIANSTTASRRLPGPPDQHIGGIPRPPKVLRFLSNTAIIHCSQQVAGFGLVEMRGATGTQTPRHVHLVEREGFFVLHGALRLHVGDRTVRLDQGQWTLAAPGVPHTVVVESGSPARWLVITDGGFDRFVATVANDHSRPTDPEWVRGVAARFGIGIFAST